MNARTLCTENYFSKCWTVGLERRCQTIGSEADKQGQRHQSGLRRLKAIEKKGQTGISLPVFTAAGVAPVFNFHLSAVSSAGPIPASW
jgi:hypothetical protein